MISAALLIAAATLAPAKPLSPDIAAARSEGDLLITQAKAKGLFANETGEQSGDGLIRLRHLASGFACTFNPGKSENRIVIYSSVRLGDDVSCTTRTATDVRTLYLYKSPEKTTEQLLSEAVRSQMSDDAGAAIQVPDPAKALRLIDFMLIPPRQTPVTPVAAGYVCNQGSHRIVVGKLDEWAIKLRFDGPAYVAHTVALDRFWDRAARERTAPIAVTSIVRPTTGTPEQQLALAKAEGEEMLRDNGLSKVFENVTSGAVIALRHKASGYVCLFDHGKPGTRVRNLRAEPPGSDVVCDSRQIDDGFVSIFITSMSVFPRRLTLSEVFEVYVAQIKQAYPDAVEDQGRHLEMSIDPKYKRGRAIIPHRTGYFSYVRNGEKVYSRMSVFVTDKWAFKQRVTAPFTKITEADLQAELTLLNAKMSFPNLAPAI